MRYGDMQDNNPKLTSFGLCRDWSHSHDKYASWHRRDAPHDGTLAVSIVAELNWSGDKVQTPGTPYCRKHAAPTKGAITRGRRESDKLILIENADVSSREAVDAQVTSALAERIAEKNAAKLERDRWVAEHKPQHLVDRLVERPGRYRVGYGLDETYGTGTVRVDYSDITPGEARYLAAQLLKAADRAEEVGVK